MPLFLFCVVAWPAMTTNVHAQSMPRKHNAFFASYCFECHGGAEPEGEFSLEQTAFELGSSDEFAVWQEVYDRIDQGAMPPEDQPQPTAEEKAAVLEWLAKQLKAADPARGARGARVQFRRLNGTEYEYTLRDLLEIPGLQIKHMLPADAEAQGFDNVGSALRVSYVQIDRYLKAARAALTEAAWLAPEPVNYKFRIPFIENHRFRTTKDRVTVGSEAVLLRQPRPGQAIWRLDAIQIPWRGMHTIRFRGRAATYVQEEGVEMGDGYLTTDPDSHHVISLYQETRPLASFDSTAEPTVHEVQAWLDPRQRLKLYVPTLYNGNPRWIKSAYTGPAVVLDWVEIEGPVNPVWPSSSYQRLFGDLPIEKWKEESGLRPPTAIGQVKAGKAHPKIEVPDRKDRFLVVSKSPRQDAKRLLSRFLEKAFRRPVPQGELERYLALVQAGLDEGKLFHEAMLDGYVAVLCSPDFLYFHEKPVELDDYALASRLSYFFWRSMPDEELLAHARDGRLKEKNVLSSEVNRLLDHPKSQRFVEDFIGQWLGLRDIRDTQPDEELYPEFDDFLLESMMAETHATFAAMVQRNLPARFTVDGDFVVANNVLADLYGLEGVEGVALREVKVPDDSPRGGLLTNASILKVTANGTTTSPVVRGAWVLERLLGTPPKPPPPNVPAIEPDTRGAKTIRETLDKHRVDPSCAQCHSRIDPPGFALESFDVIGGWRKNYRSLDMGRETQRIVDNRPVNYKLAHEVDASGALSNGREFADIREFKQLLLADERQLARNLTQRLIVFATGAEVSFADRDTIEDILDETSTTNFGVRDLIHSVVQSKLFRHK